MGWERNNSRKQRRKRRRKGILIGLIFAPLVSFGSIVLIDRAILIHDEGQPGIGKIVEIHDERCGAGFYSMRCRRYSLQLDGKRFRITSSQVSREYLGVAVGSWVPVIHVPDRFRAIYVGEKPSNLLGYFRTLEALFILAGPIGLIVTIYFGIREIRDALKRRRYRQAKQAKRAAKVREEPARAEF